MAADWWVYMVETVKGKLYTGISTDVERRFQEHQSDRAKQAKFFRSDAAKAVVYRECCQDRSAASRREAAIKKLSRQQKCALITVPD
ncbi:MAG: putative endonuclease [Oceanicoccus sp.]|jgi:putative endonuclease